MSSPAIEMDFVEANGLCFQLAHCGDGDRLALCLHGFPESHYSWRHQLPLLARLGYRAWAPDLRGYGGTTRPSEREDYALEHLLDDVAGLIDAADAREVVLLAHDWGAIIAWYFAMRGLRHLDRLVIMNVPHPVAGRAAFRRPKQLLRSWYGLFFQIPRLPEWLLGRNGARAVGESLRRSAVDPSRFSDEDCAHYSANAAGQGALKAMIDYYRAFLRGGARRQRAQGEPVIEVPTLMLWGVEDIALTIETTHGTDRWVKDLTLRYLPGVGHFVQQEAPETVNAMLEAWLTGEPVPEAPAEPRAAGA